MRVVLIFFLLLAMECAAQNVVTGENDDLPLPTRPLDPQIALQLVERERKTITASANTPEQARVREKLVGHVESLVRDWPWCPFHCTLGISGSETYFDHPDELFYVLSLALPHLPEVLRAKVSDLLATEISRTPPYAIDGYDRRSGRARERYDVPVNLRRSGRGSARSLFGIASFATYLDATGSDAAGSAERVAPHWQRIKERAKTAVASAGYKPPGSKGLGESDAAEILNGDLAGVIAFARMARQQADREIFEKALLRIAQLAQLRVDLERTSPRILVPASTASKQLHHFKLARYCRLHSDVVSAFGEEDRAVAAKRLGSFREVRPGWWMAFGDRWAGGENYISPPHLSHALFLGAALVEEQNGNALSTWVDVPWCEADLYFIEKCVLALDAK